MSVTEKSPALELHRIVSELLIPHATAFGGSRLILAQQPLQVPPDIAVRRYEAPPLRSAVRRQSRIYLSQWQQESMHAMRYPYLCYVLEGEAEMRLAFPTPRGQLRPGNNAYQIVTLYPQTFLMIPPGVLYPDGSQVHWERQPVPVADSRLFWLLFLPTTVICHTCSTHRARHRCQEDIFVTDMQLLPLVEMLIGELQSPSTDTSQAAQNLLMLIFLRVRRGLEPLIFPKAPNTTAPKSAAPQKPEAVAATARRNGKMSVNSTIVERACSYIRTHVNQQISVKDIAESVYVSPSHLARLFQLEMGTTVMKYARQQRLESARSMLTCTELAVQEVARLSGYEHVPQFNRIFKQSYGVTPTEFRTHQRRQEKI